MCVRYAANETATLQQRLNRTVELLADSQQQVQELQGMMQATLNKNAATEEEIAAMSRELAALRLRVPAGGQQAVQQHPRAPRDNFARVSSQAPPAIPPAAPSQPEMAQRRQVLKLGARPFIPARPAIAGPSQPQQEPQQALIRVHRVALPLVAAPGPAPRATPTPQRLLPGTPAHEGDVFDPSVPSKMPWRPAEFEKRPTRDLLDAVFNKIKSAVHNQPYNVIPQSKQHGERHFIGLGIKHLAKPKMVYEMLNDRSRYRYLASGIIIAMLIDKIFIQAALLDFPHDQDGHMAAFTTRYQAGKGIAQEDPIMNDFSRRMTIAENRADAAKNVQRLPRFWRWITEKAQLIAEEILPQVDIVVMREKQAFKDVLAQAANEMLRIHVRILQEPSIHHFEWLGTGYAWVSDKMINRDPGLSGSALPDRSCPWVTQCMVTPLVTEEKFERTGGSDRVFLSKETLLKAEVTLCPRKGNLRQ